MLQPEIAFLLGVIVGAISLVAAAWALSRGPRNRRPGSSLRQFVEIRDVSDSQIDLAAYRGHLGAGGIRVLLGRSFVPADAGRHGAPGPSLALDCRC
jgi:hypothetical protein